MNTPLKLFIIEEKNEAGFGYDSYDSHVIIANNEDEVRKLASIRHGDEGANAWLDLKLTEVSEIKISGESRIILSSFNAG